MRLLLTLGGVSLALSCSASDPGASFSNLGGADANAAGASSAGVAGMATATGGAAGAGGGPISAAGAPQAGSGGGGAGGSAGASGAAGTAGSGGGSCSPDASGAPGIVGDTVHDPKTCLDWMKMTQTGVNYAAAEAFCGAATTGGFDDWRIPSASELASIVTRCGQYPPAGPIDTQLFDLQGDGYWTRTAAGEPNKVCAIGMLNAGGYYHYGTEGPQVVRCVRGDGSAPAVADCTTAQGCMSW